MAILYIFKDNEGGFNWRRLTLLIPVIMFSLDAVEVFLSDWYQGVASMVTVVVFVYNFPWIISGMHSKPKYIEDLINEYELTDRNKERYKRIFEYVIGVLTSIIVGGLVYNTLRTNNEVVSWINLMGIIGGNFSLCGKFLKYSGNLFLGCLHRLKTKREKTCTTDRTEIAMKDIIPVISRVRAGSNELSSSNGGGGKGGSSGGVSTGIDLEKGLAPDHILRKQLNRGR